MGIFGSIGRVIKGLFGSSSSGGGSRSTTTYEPDKVKIAQIEAENKIRLSELETERVELIKQAQKEIIQENVKAQIAIEEAKIRGFDVMAQKLLILQEKLNDIAEKRLLIMEKASWPIIKEMEEFYGQLNKKIEDDKGF